MLRTDSRSPRFLNGDLLPVSQLWGFPLNNDLLSMRCFYKREARIFTVWGGVPKLGSHMFAVVRGRKTGVLSVVCFFLLLFF